MKKIFSKLIGATLGLALAIGVGVGVASNKNIDQVKADVGGTPTGAWGAITSANEIVAGTDYLLGYKDNNGVLCYSKSTALSSKALQTSSTLSQAKIVRFVAATDGWNIQINSSVFVGNTSGKTDLVSKNSGGDDSGYVWAPTVHTNGDIYFTANDATRFLGAASANTNANLKGYATSNGLNTYPRVTAYKLKTLSSIAVQTAPTKTTYFAGENFDPTGLVITRNFSDSTSDTYTYDGHTSEFSFSDP